MKLSEYIKQLQSTLNKSGDADIYTLDECGCKVEFYNFLKPEYKVIKDGYWDESKEEYIDDEYGIDYYLIH